MFIFYSIFAEHIFIAGSMSAQNARFQWFNVWFQSVFPLFDVDNYELLIIILNFYYFVYVECWIEWKFVKNKEKKGPSKAHSFECDEGVK